MLIWQKNNRDIYKQNEIFLAILVFPYGIIGFFMGIATPDTILQHEWAATYVQFIDSWLPYVARVGQLTKIPAVHFISAVMNIFAILFQVLMVYFVIKNVRQFSEMAKTESNLLKIGRFLLLILMGLYVYYELFACPIWDPENSRERILLNSKLGMGLYGCTINLTYWSFLGFNISWNLPYVWELQQWVKKCSK